MILYVVRTGCSWRRLPVDFPPRQTVYWHFARGEEAKVTEQILAVLRLRLRTGQGRRPEPSAGIIDSQSVKGADTDEIRLGRRSRQGRPASSALEQAERMTCRVCEDPPAASVDMKQCGAETEDLVLGLLEVRDIDIQVKLLRVRGVRPLWRSVVLHTLKREHEAGAGMKSRKVVADRPPGIGLIDHATQKRLVKLREFQNILAVQNHALQPADHRESFLWQRFPASAIARHEASPKTLAAASALVRHIPIYGWMCTTNATRPHLRP